MGWGHPPCPRQEDAGDRASFLLAAGWQSPAEAEKGKLQKPSGQEDEIGLGSVIEQGRCQLGLESSQPAGLRAAMEGGLRGLHPPGSAWHGPAKTLHPGHRAEFQRVGGTHRGHHGAACAR